MKQNIGFLYLKTGAGHISGAKILSQKLNEIYDEKVDCKLYDLFKTSNRISKIFFEGGYSITSNYFELGYITFYKLTSYKPVLDFLKIILAPFFVPKLTKFIRENNIQKIVCVHEILIHFTRLAINRVNPKIPLISIVMDPFTAHYTWFYEKNCELIIFSNKIKNEAIKQYGFNPSRVHRFPLMISEKFNKQYSNVEKEEFKKNLNIPINKKIVLIAGGGEGLKKSIPIANKIINDKADIFLIIVCGKNKEQKNVLDYLVKTKKAKNIKVLGFVNCMPELMSISDCIITKGGPATLMEALSLNKPIIISSYVRGQELGNMLYVVQNNLGWYITDPIEITDKIENILSDDDVLNEIKSKIKNMNIKNGLEDIANFIYKF